MIISLKKIENLIGEKEEEKELKNKIKLNTVKF